MSIPSGKDDADWVVGAAAQFDFVRFTSSDINGIPRSKLIPRRYVDEKLKTGVGICAGELQHVQIFCCKYLSSVVRTWPPARPSTPSVQNLMDGFTVQSLVPNRVRIDFRTATHQTIRHLSS